MSMDLAYVLFDTAALGTVANTEFILFQQLQGADAVHIETFTNARGAGSLATEEKFLIKKISVTVDYVVPPADIQKLFVGSFLEIRISDKSVFKTPCALLVDASSYSGSLQLAAAADRATIGLVGDGYELELPLLIPGGTPFRVRYIQGAALTAINSNIKINLHGILTIQ